MAGQVARKRFSEQLDEYRPDKPSTASFGLSEILQGKLVAGHVLSKEKSDIEVLYEEKVKYLKKNPKDINLLELTRSATPKEKIELTAGDEFCRLLASFDQRPSTVVDITEGQ